MREKRITDSKLWSWFTDIADQFECVGSYDDKIWFKLTDQFGNIRYQATVESPETDDGSHIVSVTIRCGDNIFLSSTMSTGKAFSIDINAYNFARKLIPHAQKTR